MLHYREEVLLYLGGKVLSDEEVYIYRRSWL